MSRAPRRRGTSTPRSTGPGAAARAPGAKARGTAGKAGRSRTRPTTGRSASTRSATTGSATTGSTTARQTASPTAPDRRAAGEAGNRVPRSRARHTVPKAPRSERRPGMWRQIAVLGLVLIAVALAIAVPLRSYLHQRDELAKAVAEQRQLQQELAQLKARKAALQDPDYIKAEARRRLQYVSPGETVYRIVAPEAPGQQPGNPETTGNKNKPAGSPPPAEPEQPWYGQMWDTLTEDMDGG